MKIYDKEEMQILADFKDTIKDEKIKRTLEHFMQSFNIIYVKYRELLHDRDNRKEEYEKYEIIGRENISLKEKLERKDRLIELLKKDKVD